LTEGEPSLTIDDAYLIQEQGLGLRVDSGEAVSAAKLGLTSVAKQVQMSVDEPLYGWLTDVMQADEAGVFELSGLTQPRVEPEVAFVIGEEISGVSVSAADVLAATSGIAPALDVLDSRFAGYKFTLVDVTADNASAAGYALGSAVAPFADLRLTGCVFEKNGNLVTTAAGAAVMDHPAEAVAWFVRKLSQRGRSLEAGTVVLAGAWTAAVPVEAGDTVTASFDHYGSVSVTFK
jgi:2-oxo-3-hexenedioate decarboxylase